MPLARLSRALPALTGELSRLPAVKESGSLRAMLARLLEAHAPSGGANLPGAIGGEIALLAAELGLGERMTPQIGSTGNAAICLGADKSPADVIVAAHMDRPSFRVRDVGSGELYPICANRFPPGEYRVMAKAVRFVSGRLALAAEGVLVSQREAEQESLRFEARHGELAWHDTVLIAAPPSFDGERVSGTGLDNCLGVLTALLAAAALRAVEEALIEQGRRCLFVFTDQEEGPPDGFFGQGAARLTGALPPPTIGCVVVDAHTAGPDLVPELGAGISHSAASGWGRGSVVPPNYHALALDLAAGLNALRPGTVQINTGYLSRSDDMILGRWAPILGLCGPPMTDPHTGHETADLGDVKSGAWWLTHFLAAVLGLAPDLAPLYALRR